ncbi:hypothetical protein FGO68_gene11216 [Halteria grandinella]|uniref:protein-tyrosine-phosphatase n=1 Tax=Halteria grandinella TaxID=5974 RepID=A0A8J8NIG1_HALGN|nr:hypothetical protein FGO68_gene11216 [Halteria grandinella]
MEKLTAEQWQDAYNKQSEGKLANYSQINDDIFLGGYEAGENEVLLRDVMGVGGVLCIYNQYKEPAFPSLYRYKCVRLVDDTASNLKEYFRDCIDFINDVITKQKKPVLVHCAAGVSRSATIVIAFIMDTYKISLDDAYQYVLKRRPCIDPNDGFMEQLREFEKELFK